MKILIINLHSALNLGDDAIMQVTLSSIQDAFPDAQITAAANDPQSWRKYSQLDVLPSICTWIGDCRLGRFRQTLYLMPVYLAALFFAAMLYRLLGVRLRFGAESKRQLLEAYYNADLVLSCGGGNFYAHMRASPSLVWALITLGFAAAIGKQTIMLPQSFGPVKGTFQRFFAARVFDRISKITVRESRSLSFLRDTLKVTRPITLLPDLAFGFPPLPTCSPQSKDKPLQIGVTVIDRGAQTAEFHNQESYENAILQTLIRLCEDHGAEIHIFVQCFGPSPDHDDRIIARRIYNRLHAQCDKIILQDNVQDALQIREAFQSMDCMIASRMHTGILAFGASTPLVMIAYQPKSHGLMELFEIPEYCFDINDLEVDKLYQSVCMALDNHDPLSQAINAKYRQIHDSLHDLPQYLAAGP